MLDDKYRIERLLAVGGMGAVYVGTHIKLRKRVAIKILNPQLNSPQMIERFHREAMIASQIGHEGIAQVTDLGTSTEGEPFLVMEYLEGESLASRLRASGAMHVEAACELACAILSPLGAAHAAGIVHRDLKPDNVFLVRQSRGEMVKLLDFGISRTTGEGSEFRLTTTGLILGTPYYMSPEQARGDSAVGPATDLYAFGVILYEMLIGQVPIQAENYNQLMYRVMTGEYVRPIEKRRDLPPALDEIIVRTMAQTPEQRPATAAELEQALLPFCRPTFREHTIERISTPRLPHKTTPPPYSSSPDNKVITGTDRTQLASPAILMAPTMPTGAQAVTQRVGKSSKTTLVIALVALSCIGGGAAIYFSQQGSKKDPDPAAVATTNPPSKPIDTGSAVAAIPTGGSATQTGSAAQTVTPATGSAAPAARATITLRFTVEPATAKITVDGMQVKGTELVVPKDDATHKLRIAAPGYIADDEEIHFDESQRLTVPLKHAARPNVTRPTHKNNDRIDETSPYH